jgi:precorrin isomerase
MTANDSTPILAPAENAREIASKIADAVNLLEIAQTALAEAVALIEKNENDPEFIMGNLQNVVGTLEIATRAARREGEDWIGYSNARNRTRR